MNLVNLSQTELQKRCAWCHRRIKEHQERFGTGARMRPEGKAIISGLEGKLTTMPLKDGREVIVIVTSAESPARGAGHDVYFQACSEACCANLEKAIRSEMGETA
jgi:hypothetical protein